MAKTSPTTLRILSLVKILAQQTDEQQGLTLPDIQAQLEDYGITVERKALYRDFDALEKSGFKIGKRSARPVQYYLDARLFSAAQMMLLVDAVQTSRSITEENSTELIEQLKTLLSKRQSAELDPHIHTTGRIKAQEDSVFNIVNIVQRALSERRDISFTYRRYDLKKQLQEVPAADGKERIKTPLFLIYSGDRYYMLAYDEHSYDHLRSYRVDRMHNVMIREASPAEHKADPNFDIAAYERCTPGMFDMKPQTIKLLVAEDRIGNVIDLFGADGPNNTEAHDVRELDKDEQNKRGTRRWAYMRITAAPSPVLFGQIAQFGGDVRIVYPKNVVTAYETHLKRVLDAQRLQ